MDIKDLIEMVEADCIFNTEEPEIIYSVADVEKTRSITFSDISYSKFLWVTLWTDPEKYIED